MSQKGNLDPENNLCVTEDAFDQFQVNSMYEEEEFITLSDIAPSEDAAPVILPDNMSEIPYDNEVVLNSYPEDETNMSSLSEPLPEITIPAPPAIPENIPPEIPCLDGEIPEPHTQEQPETGRPKRNRKKRNSYVDYVTTNDEQLSEEMAVDESTTLPAPKRTRKNRNSYVDYVTTNDEQLSQEISIDESSTMPAMPALTGKRRGRKPKNNKNTINLNGSQTQNYDTSQNVTDFPQPTVTRKPGRAKKNLLHNETNIDVPLDDNLENKTSTLSTDSIPNNDVSIECKTSGKRRGRKKQGSSKISITNDILQSTTEIKEDGHDLDDTASKPKSKREKKQKKINASIMPTEELVLEADNMQAAESVTESNDFDEDCDDICLSKLKKTIDNNFDPDKTFEKNELEDIDQTLVKNVIGDIDSNDKNDYVNSDVVDIVDTNDVKIENNVHDAENSQNNSDIATNQANNESDSHLVESTSKRPVRRKTKQNFYHEDSDEDPFANVELSDDDDPRGRKGKKYDDDDEYIPDSEIKHGKECHLSDELSDSDIDIDDDLEGLVKPGRRKRNSLAKSPKKRRKNSEVKQEAAKITPEVETITPNVDDLEDDIEVCLQSSIIKTGSKSQELEQFIAQKIQGTNIQIKKVAATESTQALDIPVIDPQLVKKYIDGFTQTNAVKKVPVGIQTTTQYDVPMKTNLPLSAEQSQKACDFLQSVVQTTSELGQLMTQKSDDFIAKKINTNNVTDTFKMDYCVRKSFLLFKLAKHNLLQMEDDLAKQYDEFLKNNGLESCREAEKQIQPKSRDDGSDSDCEIIETPVQPKPKKPAFNPKTVFLNKELSIKIAKKTETPEKKATPKGKQLNVKGRHTVWINDSIQVKKVKPTQSFLAQDSRNKKPPDCYITEEMVKDFFDKYYHYQAQSLLAPYVSTEWCYPQHGMNYACCYFFVKSGTSTSTSYNAYELSPEHVNGEKEDVKPQSDKNVIQFESPETLFTLCTRVLQKHLEPIKVNENCPVSNDNTSKSSPDSLFRLCLDKLTKSEEIESLNTFSSCYEMDDKTHEDVCQPFNIHHEIKIDDQDERNITSLAEKRTPLLPKFHFVNSLKKMCFNKIVCILNSQEDINSVNNQIIKSYCSRSNDNQEVLDNKKEYTINMEHNVYQRQSPKFLKTLCCDQINGILNGPKDYPNTIRTGIDSKNLHIDENCNLKKLNNIVSKNATVKSLFSLCVDFIRMNQTPRDYNHCNDKYFTEKSFTPELLKHMAFKQLKQCLYNSWDFTELKAQEKSYFNVKRLAEICFENISKAISNDINFESINTELTINAVNTLSEEAFHSINESHVEVDENNEYLADNGSFYNDDEYETFDNAEDETNWVSQLQVEELRSVSTKPNTISKEIVSVVPEEHLDVTRIKFEQLDENEREVENVEEQAIIKTEPTFHQDEMTVIPETVITKRENIEDIRRDGDSYGADMFQTFVTANERGEEIFTQSTSRVRRQYDPDSDNEEQESFSDMSLLIPQTFEPLHIENAKDSLMETSSDEGSNKKVTSKKRAEKRSKAKKGLLKKPDSKVSNKDAPSSKEKVAVTVPLQNNEVARLTRRMKGRIRQEEKKVVSSESDTEDLSVGKRKDKDSKSISDKSKQTNKKTIDEEIQCSNVDSTANNDEKEQLFTGFTAIDQNEISSYQKFVNYVYDKIIPSINTQSEVQSLETKETESLDQTDDNRPNSPLINPDEPIEMLECQPTMPVFEQLERPKRLSKGKAKQKKEITEKIKNIEMEKLENSVLDTNETKNTSCVLRYGWECYPIDPKDGRLYQIPALVLEKLPESFVNTYFEYQNITSIRKEDEEVDRLINLQTLNRSSNVKDIKFKPKPKSKRSAAEQDLRDIYASAPEALDDYAELTPSEDEHDASDELLPLAPPQQSTNTADISIAKNSLMNDSDSDSGMPKIKKEIMDESQEQHSRPKKKSKISPKKTEDKEHVHPDNLMLTADKMMNKELNLLHAPVVLNDDTPESADKAPASKKRKSGSKKDHSKDSIKAEDDSSSEEEKQWVSTKEKLLKRMGRKDATSVDDAKRAKLVSEFIERRGERERKSGRGRSRKPNLKMRLEREKQLKVLSRELYGDTTVDERRRGKLQSQSLFKGRRNIRKVIDKKSLARSTVIANMEEFERKRRLTQKQNKLCEALGCEEGVNVLVINGEVCLEYDFEMQQPVVTIHPFFTNVMKAHQYEGVKFMWDACFESLERIASGHPGGGCILAHCMGLGKTLQVLALLHTVLTHPGVGMQRVLVCCPLSTVLNWVDEIHKWMGPVTDQIKVFELSKLKKTYERAYQLEDWYNGGGIFIIGYELFRSLSLLDPDLDEVRPTIVKKIRTALLDPGPDIVVCDEGHLLKNDSSVLAVAMSRVETKRRIILTGTPMQNNLREYYCMVNFIKPNLLGTYSEFSNRFENPIMNGQHRDSQSDDIKLMKQRTHILHKVLEGCLQRQEASVLYPYLPKKHEYTLFVSLTKCQWDLYKHYMATYANQHKQNILKDFHTLQKIWSHPQVLHNFQMRSKDESAAKVKPEKLEDDLATEDLAASEDIQPNETEPEVWWLQHLDGGKMLESLKSSNKFVIIFKILDECIKLGDKVLIFSTSLITMDSLEFFLKKMNKWSLGQEYYRLDGTVPPEVRQKWCREFNAEHNHKTKLFLISTRAGCLGLNLVAANRVIILDTSWNPAHDIQSIFRVYRFGQKKDCYIYRLVALGTMEQKIYERSVTKQAVACRVVDEQQIDRHYNMAELTELYRYDEAGACVAGGVAVGVCDVALLRVARAACLHAVHEHDSLLRGSSETQLPEDERHAIWMQFQEEQAHKQIQNQLTSSFTPHLPVKTYKANVQSLALQPNPNPPSLTDVEIKTEETVPPAPQPTDNKTKKKKKGKNPITQCHIPVQNEDSPQTSEPPEDDSVVKKIMDILIKHNFHNNQNPEEVEQLISSVKKIVAYRKVPKGTFNKELTRSIANVLLGQGEPPPLTNIKHEPPQFEQPPAEPPPTEKPQPEPPKRGRGRPRKYAPSDVTDTDTSVQEISDVDLSQPSTSKQVERPRRGRKPKPKTPQIEPPRYDSEPPSSDTDGRPRRKAALAAESKRLSIARDGVVDLGDDDDWLRDDDPEYLQPILPAKQTVPEKPALPAKPAKKTKATASKAIEIDSIQKAIDKQLNMDANSILLSDDDEPAPVKKTIKIEKVAGKQEPKVSLHASLLSNQNFIKIVAHTYREGNPMLDEDAALLAAQYSALKAQKELETTGKAIESGPIYDIAMQVLGPDILKRLHETKPAIKTPEKRVETPTKPETVAKTAVTTRPKVKVRVTSDLMPAAKVNTTQNPEILTMSRGVATKFAVTASGGSTPSIVPVGLFKRFNVTPEEEEESILPDDEDIRIVTDPVPPVANPPLNLNQLLTEAESIAMISKPGPKSKAKPIRVTSVASEPYSAPQAPAVAPTASDTICLDSDEEPEPPPPPAPSHKRVALKSTAKKQTSNIVPVSLTAANNPQVIKVVPETPQFVNRSYIDPVTGLTQNQKLMIIPANQIASHISNLPKGLNPQQILFANNSQAISMNQNVPQAAPQVVYANPMMNMNRQPTLTVIPPTYKTKGAKPQNITILPSTSVDMMGQAQQNFAMASSIAQNISPVTSVSQTYTIAPQMNMAPVVADVQAPPTHSTPAVSAPLPAPTVATREPPASTSLTTENKKALQKTVCKPGDILRITKSGAVEILNRDDNEPVEKVSKTTKNISKPRRQRKIMKSSSSSSSSSSEEEPERPAARRTQQDDDGDPLAILRDVVHIKAVDDDIIAQDNKLVGDTMISKYTKNVISAKHNPTKDKDNKVRESLLRNKPSETPGGRNKPSATPGGSRKPTSNLAKPAAAPCASVDLTHVDITPTRSETQPKPNLLKILNEKKTPSKIVGTSNNIIISGKGKTMTLKQRNMTPSAPIARASTSGAKASPSPVVRATSSSTAKASPAAKWNDAKKRPPPAPAPVPGTSKKRKTEPLTLKDFDIDDIDDIIELD